MARVTLPSFILSLSGQMGNLCFRTSADGKTCVYLAPRQKRSKPVSENEMRARNLFKERAQRVKNLMLNDPTLTVKQAWKIVKQIPI